ncbi:hypothetical protein ABVK25_010873 [Lepraria finkii]|uniref:Uncharacterized protein n=1 Tax=Lepraria finkii TaxID=1340010 RepID=A0ABR4AT41_9LECA
MAPRHKLMEIKDLDLKNLWLRRDLATISIKMATSSTRLISFLAVIKLACDGTTRSGKVNLDTRLKKLNPKGNIPNQSIHDASCLDLSLRNLPSATIPA